MRYWIGAFALVSSLCSSLAVEAQQPQKVPGVTLAEAAQMRAQLEQILIGLGDDAYETREAASLQLLGLGPRAIPLMAKHVNHPDVEVARRVRRALSRLRGVPGAAVEGLVLSAALVGTEPSTGEAVTLWLTLTNTSKNDVYILQYFWRLALQSTKNRGTDHPRTVSIDTPAELTPHDFLRLKPGESACYLMDADPVAAAESAPLTNAWLEISLPKKAASTVPGFIFSSSNELASGPIAMLNAGNLTETSAEVRAFSDDIVSAAPQAVERTDNKELYGSAVRYGLRRAQSADRWKIFEFICAHPLPVFENDIVDFIGRFGPRLKQEGHMLELIRLYANSLPAPRRAPFLLRCALAMGHDWRSITSLMNDFTSSQDLLERAVAARAFIELFERGDRRPDVLDFVAWELFTTPDPKLHDAAKAVEFAQFALDADPNPERKIALACMKGDYAALNEIESQASNPAGQNNLAWKLATKFPAGTALSNLAVKLATHALQDTDKVTPSYAYRMETLAVSHAAAGNYERALALEQDAFERLTKTDEERPNYANRIAAFTALVMADKIERPALVLAMPPLHSDAARDALLARLPTEQQPEIRSAIVKLLQASFGADEKVKRTIREAR